MRLQLHHDNLNNAVISVITGVFIVPLSMVYAYVAGNGLVVLGVVGSIGEGQWTAAIGGICVYIITSIIRYRERKNNIHERVTFLEDEKREADERATRLAREKVEEKLASEKREAKQAERIRQLETDLSYSRRMRSDREREK